MNQYYYVISSLPELRFRQDFSRHPFAAFDDFVKEELRPEDYTSLKCCFLLNDVRNLLSMTDGKPDFIRPSYYSPYDLEDAAQDPDLLFPFFSESLAAIQNETVSTDPATAETLIASGLMDALWNGEFLGAQKFARDYLIFEMRLRNVATALSCRGSEIPFSHRIVRFDHFSERVADSSAPDFSLGGDLDPFTPMIEIYENESPAAAERALTAIRWRWLDERTEHGLFSADAVCAAAIKFADIERWLTLSPDEGRRRLDEVLEKLHQEIRRISREETA